MEQSVVSVQQFWENEKEDTRRWLQMQMNWMLDAMINNLFDRLQSRGYVPNSQRFVELSSLSRLHQSSKSHRNHDCGAINETNEWTSTLATAMAANRVQTNVKNVNFNNAVKNTKEISHKSGSVKHGTCLSASDNQANKTDLSVVINLVDDDDEEEEEEKNVLAVVSKSENKIADTDDNHNNNNMDNNNEDNFPDIVFSDTDESFQHQSAASPSTSKRRIGNLISGQIIATPESYQTEGLLCLDPNCNQYFPKDQFDEHMFTAHSIQRFRCLQRGCDRSFANAASLATHNRESHPNPRWLCVNCRHEFSTPDKLKSHLSTYHQIGKFRCSQPGCRVMSTTRNNAIQHFKRDHTYLMCTLSHCRKKIKSSAMKAHLRTHLGIAPFRCKWPDCDFASAARGTVTNHIRSAHFNTPRTKRERALLNIVEHRKPADYIEVLSDLLI